MEQIDRGELYMPGNPEIGELMCKAAKNIREYNSKNFEDITKNDPLLAEIFGEYGSFYISAPFKCELGVNIKIGMDFYANSDCIFLDQGKITIGNNVLLGPRVMLITVGHPVHWDLRNEGPMYAFPIKICDNVWVGAGTIINPGVTIGKNTVIGAGSVVTRDIPEGVVAVGNPCRILRKITDEDKTRYFKNRYINK